MFAKKPTKDPHELTAAEQIEVMRTLRQQAVAQVACIAPRTLRDHAELRDDRGRYDIEAVIRYIRARCESAQADAPKTEEPSPAEIIKQERAKLLILDRMERESTLVSRDETRKVWALLAEMIRNATVVLRRQYGEDAAQVLTDMMDEYAAAVEGWQVDEAYLEAAARNKEPEPAAKRKTKHGRGSHV